MKWPATYRYEYIERHMPWDWIPVPHPERDRHARIARQYTLTGSTLVDVGSRFDISPERVRQITFKHRRRELILILAQLNALVMIERQHPGVLERMERERDV